jgi:aspartate racemase
MKTIGLIGGMSWQSTVTYYQLINEGIQKILGGFHSAKLVLYSVDFDEIEKLQHQGKWSEMGSILNNAAKHLEEGGADFLILCTNTMHKLSNQIVDGLNIPLLHIADATGERIKASGIQKVGLLGTRFTMEQDFYRKHLEIKSSIATIIPDLNDRKFIHMVIYDELCHGHIKPSSRKKYMNIISKLKHRGAEGVILGCTEIALLVNPSQTSLPLFNTTEIHAHSAVNFALDGSNY